MTGAPTTFHRLASDDIRRYGGGETDRLETARTLLLWEQRRYPGNADSDDFRRLIGADFHRFGCLVIIRSGRATSAATPRQWRQRERRRDRSFW